MHLRYVKTRSDAIEPRYATVGAACFDLFSPLGWNPAALRQGGEKVVIPTGLAVDIPTGHGLFIFSRSGHGFNFDTRLSNCVGIIDSDYRGEVKVSLVRDSLLGEDGEPLRIIPGRTAIAQACVLPLARVAFTEVDELDETERGAGGFGSTS